MTPPVASRGKCLSAWPNARSSCPRTSASITSWNVGVQLFSRSRCRRSRSIGSRCAGTSAACSIRVTTASTSPGPRPSRARLNAWSIAAYTATTSAPSTRRDHIPHALTRSVTLSPSSPASTGAPSAHSALLQMSTSGRSHVTASATDSWNIPVVVSPSPNSAAVMRPGPASFCACACPAASASCSPSVSGACAIPRSAAAIAPGRPL
jgi:hypothetical protein